MPYLTPLSLCIFSLFPAHFFAQIDLEWVVPVQEKYVGGTSLSAMSSADVVSTPNGRVYACGRSGSRYSHDLLFGREELPAEGRRNMNYYI